MKFIKGAIYRQHTALRNVDASKNTGYYLDVLCNSDIGTGVVIKCHPEKLPKDVRYVDGEWKSGLKLPISENSKIVALTLEDYEYEMPVVEKVVIEEVVKEVIIEKEVIVNVNKYEETFIDHAYNYYCKLKNRFFSEFI